MPYTYTHPYNYYLQGNVGLAIFFTVASNCVGVIFVPLWLKVLLRPGTSGIENININVSSWVAVGGWQLCWLQDAELTH